MTENEVVERCRERVNTLEARVGKLQHGLILASSTLEYVRKGVIQPDGGAVIKALEDISAALAASGDAERREKEEGERTW